MCGLILAESGVLGTVAVLQRPHVKTVFSSRAFSAAAPAVRNSLDINTRSAETFLSFGRKLMTELFVKSYDA